MLIDPSTANDICSVLRAWRIRSRLRQDAVAKCLGVAQSQISRWESGRDLPRPHNIEAIRRLVSGAEIDPLLALRHFVLHSNQHLLLLDDQHDILARSLPFHAPANLLDRFGWVLDPERNPNVAPVRRRYGELLRGSAGVIGMSIALPYLNEGNTWLATVSGTIHAIAGTRVCLCELGFDPAPDSDGAMRIEEVRLDPAGETRRATRLWHKPHRQ